jgi:hypothetical protein
VTGACDAGAPDAEDDTAAMIAGLRAQLQRFGIWARHAVPVPVSLSALEGRIGVAPDPRRPELDAACAP